MTEFDRVTAQDPKGKLGLQALYRSAVTEDLFLAKYEDAVRRLKQYADAEAETDPAAAWEAERQIGEILFSKLDQYDRAILHYKALLQRKADTPEAPEFLFRIGKSQFFLWQFDEAVATYRDLIKRYRGSPLAERASYEIGVTYFTRGEQRPGGSGPGVEAYQDAIDAYQKFMRAYPRSALVPEAQFGMASCLEEMDQLDAAYHAYEALRGADRYPAPKVIEIKLARIRERKAQRSQMTMKKKLTLLACALLLLGLTPGQTAPDFTAKDQDGKTIMLSQYRGSPVLIYFYPKDDTPGCTKEACTFRDQYSKFQKLGAVILGVSRQDEKSHQAFKTKYHLPFELLIDLDGSIATSFGVGSMPMMSLTKRQSVLIDKDGKVIRFYDSVDPAKHADEVLADLQKQKNGG